jgi:hypothetical protein
MTSWPTWVVATNTAGVVYGLLNYSLDTIQQLKNVDLKRTLSWGRWNNKSVRASIVRLELILL